MPFPENIDELRKTGYVSGGKSTCKCGAALQWWTTPKGKQMPMDAGTARPHFARCPLASRFRKKKPERCSEGRDFPWIQNAVHARARSRIEPSRRRRQRVGDRRQRMDESIQKVEVGHDNSELVTMDIAAYRDAIIQIDYIFEELESLNHRWDHLETCTDDDCGSCKMSRQEHRRMVEQMNGQLRNVVELLTHRRVREVLAKEFGASAHVLESTVPKPKRLPGPKRFELGRLNTDRAILDSLWRFGKQWKRLGDFTRKDCRQVAEKVDSLEQAARTVKEAFRAIEEKLQTEKSSSVEDSFTEQELDALFSPAMPSLGRLRSS